MEYFAGNPFTTAAYLTLTKNKLSTHDRSYLKALNSLPNEKLFEKLMAWRKTTAEKAHMMPNMIFSDKTLSTIAEKLPSLLKALSAVKGVGPQKAAQYGPELITLIRSYQQELIGSQTEQGSLF
jgi:superfamily II DNA helicase RecQ